MLDIVDDYMNFVFSIPLATKDQAYPTPQAWQFEVEKETGDRVRMYSVDNGTELTNLIGINAPIFSHFNLILTNLACFKSPLFYAYDC